MIWTTCITLTSMVCMPPEGKVKVKFSHTRYRALGPELIPVYSSPARDRRSTTVPCHQPIHQKGTNENLTFPPEGGGVKRLGFRLCVSPLCF